MLALNVIIICIEAYFLIYKYQSNKNRTIFFVITCLQVILLSGLRHMHIGMDTYNYYNMFESVKYMSWRALFERLIDITSYAEGVEPGFYLSIKLFQVFSGNFRIYLIAFACFVNIPLFVMLYKKSMDPFLSVLVYVELYFAFFSTTGLRQTMAVVIMSFFGYKFVMERKLLPFLLLTALAYTCHRSAIAFLPFYFIAYKKPTKYYFICCLVLMVILFVLRDRFTILLGTLGGYEEYTDQYEGAGTWNFSVLTIAMLLVSMWKYNKMCSINKDAQVYVNASIVSCLLLPITFVDPSNLRVVFYYSIYSMLQIPLIVRSFDDKERKIVLAMVIGLLLIMYFKSPPVYRFFWQPGIYNSLPSI